jgi:hypothetical protein
MFAIAGLIAFIIAALFKLVGTHADAIEWLIIIGGILFGLELVFGFFGWRPLHRTRA